MKWLKWIPLCGSSFHLEMQKIGFFTEHTFVVFLGGFQTELLEI
jgi:hypothetical protein